MKTSFTERETVLKETGKATLWGLLVMLMVAGLIVIGSRNLAHFDAALVGYTFAVLFATFAIAYRYAMWLQRPPTALYWKRGWQLFFHPRYILRNVVHWVQRITSDFLLNIFIFRRNRWRGSAHWLIMWGCLIATAVTVPLTFGWIHFKTLPDNLDWYRAYIFGFPTFAFPIHSIVGFLVFHILVFASILVIVGVMLAMRRRMQEHGAAALQQFGEDFLPLILLFAISVTGLMLTASYTWMKGYGYDFLAILHALTVIFTLLWLPFGKLFHIFQRPAQLGVSFYKDIGARSIAAHCRRCNEPFSSRMHIEDLIQVQQQLGYRYEVKDTNIEHYQWICPRCRRAMVVLAQGRQWQANRGGEFIHTKQPPYMPHTDFGNPQIGFGPLSDEDRQNFHL
ncbi:MAG: MFS transporter [Acidobacteriota bacterium]